MISHPTENEGFVFGPDWHKLGTFEQIILETIAVSGSLQDTLLEVLERTACTVEQKAMVSCLRAMGQDD